MNADDMLDRLSGPLSRRRRLAQAFALVAGLAGAAFVGLLWATEPDLPGRTQAAFAGLTAVGLAWTVYGAWGLTRRTPLFALDRVVAAWMALGATILLTAGAATLRANDPDGSILPTVVAALLVVASVADLVLARSRRAALLRRRDALAR
jgi:hypothetical protein